MLKSGKQNNLYNHTMESVFFSLPDFFLRPPFFSSPADSPLIYHFFFALHFSSPHFFPTTCFSSLTFFPWHVCIHVASLAVLRRSDDVRSRTRSSRCTSPHQSPPLPPTTWVRSDRS